MNSSPPHLAAVCAYPDDDNPRLAYADWLDERGDPFGQFIRLQCALHKALKGKDIPDENAAWFHMYGDGIGSMVAVAHQLFLRLRHRLSYYFGTGLDRWTCCPRWCDVRRGFPDYAQLWSRAFFENATEIFRAAPIRRVRLDDWPEMHLTWRVGTGSLAEHMEVRLFSKAVLLIPPDRLRDMTAAEAYSHILSMVTTHMYPRVEFTFPGTPCPEINSAPLTPPA